MIAKVILLSLCLASCSASTGSSLRAGRMEGSGRVVETEEVEASLRESLDAVLRGAKGNTAKQLQTIEASIWQTYQALPKNGLGRLGHRAVRYLVHNYFAREHGWLINGLEPHGNRDDVSEMHELSILQDKAPALVESLLEVQRGDHGLLLADTVAMVAALERLIFDESLTSLHAAYSLNNLTTIQTVNESSLHEVLSSYLLLFEMGEKAGLHDTLAHQKIKHRAAQIGGNWPFLIDFEQDAVMNYDFAQKQQANPFVAKSYTFQEAAEITEGLASGYGKWQNLECSQMKADLMDLYPDGKGLVPVSKFYSQPDHAAYHFSESMEYLRTIGALDENLPGEPRVRIANYMIGPSNCIASSTYYSVCCLNECESLMNELEAKVRKPAEEPGQLLDFVSNMSSSTVDGHRELSQALMRRLHDIASRHGGQVQLHSRLFAQWMHHVFPNECPYPEMSDDVTVLTPSHWLDKKQQTSVPKEQREHLVAKAERSSSQANSEITWSEEDVLHAILPARPARSTSASLLRLVSQLAMLLGLLRVAVGSWQSIAGAHSAMTGKKQANHLPF
eukprot:TRINITY_DN20034_c0_g1_i1.p1 TRINITY_DN20034_c0_g1~~TRINITY_DN20034_c0_g1_i1.p1  ORF type:complete len:590 (-),score=119.08 TRINITY_DN20034_c0_g1_i1:168-1853(-)